MAQRYAGTVKTTDYPLDLDWLHADRPLSLKDVRGKLVILEFWTFC